MTGLMFIFVLAVGLVLLFTFPPIGLLVLSLLVIWVVWAIVKGGVRGLMALLTSKKS